MFFKKYAGEGEPQAKAPLEHIRTKLKALRGDDMAMAEEVGGDRTVTNDGPVPADKKAQIVRDEALVQAVLALFGVDYAALITHDEGADGQKSPYAMAVAAHPDLIAKVLAADNPVLAALQVAVAYKPYAAFQQKYGQDPEAIEKAIAQNVKGNVQPKEQTVKPKGPVFSSFYGSAMPEEPRAGGELARLFGK